MFKHDPIEDTPEFQAIREELEAKIIAKIGENCGLGYCHLYWATKKAILAKEYHIKWRSPAVMNPGVRFD